MGDIEKAFPPNLEDYQSDTSRTLRLSLEASQSLHAGNPLALLALVRSAQTSTLYPSIFYHCSTFDIGEIMEMHWQSSAPGLLSSSDITLLLVGKDRLRLSISAKVGELITEMMDSSEIISLAHDSKDRTDKCQIEDFLLQLMKHFCRSGFCFPNTSDFFMSRNPLIEDHGMGEGPSKEICENCKDGIRKRTDHWKKVIWDSLSVCFGL